MSPEPYAETNPPFPIPPAWRHKLRPVAEWPHDLHRMFALAWQEDGRWLGMWGHYDDTTGRFRAAARLRPAQLRHGKQARAPTSCCSRTYDCVQSRAELWNRNVCKALV